MDSAGVEYHGPVEGARGVVREREREHREIERVPETTEQTWLLASRCSSVRHLSSHSCIRWNGCCGGGSRPYPLGPCDDDKSAERDDLVKRAGR